MRYSIQTIKYDLLCVLREYDSDGSRWSIATSPLPPAESLAALGLNAADYVYVGKPASTPRAAEIARDFFAERFGVSTTPVRAAPDRPADWVLLYRLKECISAPVTML